MSRRGRPPHPDVLTPREWEVLALLRDGLSNPEIAGRLGISRDGAKFHVSEILTKLGLESREEAARWQPRAQPWWASALAPAGLLWGKAKALLPAPLSGAALVVSGGLVVATLAGLGLVAFLLVRDGGGGQAQQAAGLRDALLAGQPVEFVSCRDDPAWVQPPFNDVFSDPGLDSLSREEALRFYRQHVYQVQPGESANRLITAASGEAASGRESGGAECVASAPPDVYPVGSVAAYTLVYFEPLAVLRKDNVLAVTLSPRETGISTLDVPLEEPMPSALTSFFVDEGGQFIAVCGAAGCERADLLPVQPPRRTGVPEVDTVIDALFSGDPEAVLSLIQYETLACVSEVTSLGGPPECEDDETDGTPVEVFGASQCEGYYVRPKGMEGTLRWLTRLDKDLYAVYRSDGFSWPPGQYLAIIAPLEGANGFASTVPIEGGAIVGVDFGCAMEPAEAVEFWGLTEAVLPPVEPLPLPSATP